MTLSKLELSFEGRKELFCSQGVGNRMAFGEFCGRRRSRKVAPLSLHLHWRNRETLASPVGLFGY